ncbi:MAG: Gfo/Idh/MocA family oxidoreductase [Candidatus Aminicenantes bacterium]|nr:MAG: Gfo/Idh/MocA family oxidoreductase [Candidatus Aminicenantes bacterium]
MKKNIAVMGCGHWGKNLIRNFHELDSLYAICDIDEEKLKSFKEKYQDAAVYYDLKTLLADSNIEAVVISTPAETHFSLAKEVLSSGKDVFIEKPIALNYRDGEELVSLAAEKNKILMVGHLLEYHPAIIKLKEIIDKGDIGKIHYIYSNRLNLGKFRTEENILWSFAPHDISVIINLLGEMPDEIFARGGNYLNPHITDVTVTTMNFPSGVKAHIFVSWLHPYKEQKLVVIGDKQMVVFDDVNPSDKLFSYSHKIDWIDRLPIPRPEEAEPIDIEKKEPLRAECEHFIDCITTRNSPKTDGENGLKVLKILEECQKYLKESSNSSTNVKNEGKKYFVHESSFVDEGVEIGEGTKIWHFSHVLKNTKLGKNCNVGQNVMLGPNVTIGNNVKIQNNVSVYDGVILEDDVFCGPSMVFTNVIIPRSHWPRKNDYQKTLVKKGATLGANSTVVCGITVGKYAFVGAGALVNKDIPDYALVYGVPGSIQGWMCYCGEKLSLTNSADSSETAECVNCGRKYKKEKTDVLEVDKASS